MNFCDLFHISIESHDFESRDFFTSIVQSLHQVHSLCLLIVFNYLFKCSMMLRLWRFFLSPSSRWKSRRPFLEFAVHFSIHSHYFLSPFSNREKIIAPITNWSLRWVKKNHVYEHKHSMSTFCFARKKEQRTRSRSANMAFWKQAYNEWLLKFISSLTVRELRARVKASANEKCKTWSWAKCFSITIF